VLKRIETQRSNETALDETHVLKSFGAGDRLAYAERDCLDLRGLLEPPNLTHHAASVTPIRVDAQPIASMLRDYVSLQPNRCGTT
jgi:hypothetical protein